MMDLELAKFLFQVLTFLMTGGIGIYVYLSNKDKVTNDRIDTLQKATNTKIETLETATNKRIGELDTELGEKIEHHGQRIASIEAKGNGSPTHADLAEIHEKINEVSNNVSALKGEFTATNRTLILIHETLMERK